MTNRTGNRTSDTSARLVATLGVALGLTIISADAAALLGGGLTAGTTCTSPGFLLQPLEPAAPPLTGLTGSLTAPPCAGSDSFGAFTASADVTSFVDYGVMKTIGHASSSGLSGDSFSSTSLVFRDMVTFDPVSGALIGTTANVNAQMQLHALLTHASWDLTVTGVPTLTSLDFDCSDPLNPCKFDLTLGMTFGMPMLLQVNLQAADLSSGGAYDGSFDLSASVYWGGIQSVTVGGQPVPFTITSASGHDWTQSSVPSDNGSVPEPATLALLGLGLAGLGFSRRKQ